jgi:hypothetical protein
VARVEPFVAQRPPKTPVAIEASDTWWWLVDLLEGLGHPPILSRPKQTEAIMARCSSCPPTAFTKCESVGWEAKAGPARGSRSSRSLWTGSSASRAVSLPSALPQAIP